MTKETKKEEFVQDTRAFEHLHGYAELGDQIDKAQRDFLQTAAGTEIKKMFDAVVKNAYGKASADILSAHLKATIVSTQPMNPADTYAETTAYTFRHVLANSGNSYAIPCQ